MMRSIYVPLFAGVLSSAYFIPGPVQMVVLGNCLVQLFFQLFMAHPRVRAKAGLPPLKEIPGYQPFTAWFRDLCRNPFASLKSSNEELLKNIGMQLPKKAVTDVAEKARKP